MTEEISLEFQAGHEIIRLIQVKNHISSFMACLALVEFHALQRRLSICRSYVKIPFVLGKIPCLKIMTGCNEDTIKLISNGIYFNDEVPVLVINNGSNEILSYIELMKNKPKVRLSSLITYYLLQCREVE